MFRPEGRGGVDRWLFEINGIGTKKADDLGETLFQVIREYCHDPDAAVG